jgi:hypothetical protein
MSESTSATVAGTRLGRDTYKILAKYSAQGLAQSQISFYVSIVFAALGFLVILSGAGVAVFTDAKAATAAIPLIGGGNCRCRCWAVFKC